MMSVMTTVMRRCTNRLARFAYERRGIAAVEFAMLLPVMMTLFLGSVEVTTGVSIQRKLNIAARALADLSSQYTAIDASEMTNILNAPSDIIVPYATANLQSVLSEVAIDGNGNATVVWSATLNGTARTVGQSLTVPTNLDVPNTYLLLGETAYSYNPTYGYVVTGTMTLNSQMYMRPRQSNSVSYTE
jgi:Flp pilus assembly protein TadG